MPLDASASAVVDLRDRGDQKQTRRNRSVTSESQGMQDKIHHAACSLRLVQQLCNLIAQAEDRLPSKPNPYPRESSFSPLCYSFGHDPVECQAVQSWKRDTTPQMTIIFVKDFGESVQVLKLPPAVDQM